MEETPFHAFLHFVSLYNQCMDERARMREYERAASQARCERDALEEKVASVRQALAVEQKRCDTGEMELADLAQRLRAKQQQAEEARSARQAQALEQEVEKLRAAHQEQEDDLLACIERKEELERELAHVRDNSKARKDELEQKLAQAERAYGAHKERATSLWSQIQSYNPDFPRQWYDHVMRLADHVNNPVVSLHNGACSGCGAVVPPQTRVRLSRNAVVACGTCNRLLYDEHQEST